MERSGSRKRVAPSREDDDDDPPYAAGGSDGGTGSTTHAPQSSSRNTGTRPFDGPSHTGAQAGEARQWCAACVERWRVEGGPPRRPAVAGARGVYTLCDVEHHSSPGDAWLISHGRVYDVTSFIPQHPGGRESIIRHAGTDCSEDHDFHSAAAQKLWGEFRIGRLRPCLRSGPLHGVMGAYACALQ